MADEDVIGGKLKQVEGRIQDAVGDLTGNPKDDIEGKAKQVEGKIQESVGHADNAVQDQARSAEALTDAKTGAH